ncbi:glucans biosynthesis glucosyltransferase MdoH [Mangrovicoccus algicola]|uniref:Glucans biosynthesis glucosyltransferase H n=1 Tax=Mangrovicoccus algicola TaxID=2771008 RepID=A0A8J6YYT7_9RHOB|nr:glucans biosynthesis glucosyltransferase MdoH [Mangrovicoccus algicola]MBE3639139.1 glucans biosynthesis glucosyltransferase MdoH [Mangrovicoccus algicola]
MIDLATGLRRTICLAAAAAAGILAGALFIYHAGSTGIGLLDVVIAVVIAMATWWIAWGACQGVTGLVTPVPRRPTHDGPIHSRTCILVPVYNEDPVAVYARIAAMDADLKAEGIDRHFHFAILSDTRKAELGEREEEELARLLKLTSGEGRIFYRRRIDNTGRKAGNIEDFIQRSGGAYDLALILDADSLMSADTIGEMVRRMEESPDVGLLQSLPRVIGARSRFGRMMQFSAGFYAPIYCNGLTALAGRTGSFWGHNAMVRISAFAQSCGLPELRGKPPFGGQILSHDSVEAALLARADWQVRIDPDLGGSFEEGPDDLIEYAKRDRRWAQGNLQHARLLVAPGLKGWSRFALFQGIVAYTAPAIWALFLILSLVAAATESAINYFPMPDFPVPIFPGERTAAAIGLFAGVIGLLFLSKFLVLGHALVTGRAREFGGGTNTFVSTLTELLLSSIIAPLLMMFQLRALWQILSGRDGGWPTASRDSSAVPLKTAFAASWWMTLAGLVLFVFAAIFAPRLIPWLMPVGLPLVIAPWLISWTSRRQKSRLMTTQSQSDPPTVIRAFRAHLSDWETAPAPAPVAPPAPAASGLAALG